MHAHIVISPLNDKLILDKNESNIEQELAEQLNCCPCCWNSYTIIMNILKKDSLADLHHTHSQPNELTLQPIASNANLNLNQPAFEIITASILCSFLEDDQSSIPNFACYELVATLAAKASLPSERCTKDILERLKCYGGREQLIMFLTGSSGGGNSILSEQQGHSAMCFVIWCQCLLMKMSFLSLHGWVHNYKILWHS
ncbi:MAG: hypothetical protein ACRDL7_01790 [Gaiellaceae bacterium]